VELAKEIEALQREWVAMTLAEAIGSQLQKVANVPHCCSKWRWLIVGNLLVVVVGGFIYVWCHHRHGVNDKGGVQAATAGRPGGGGEVSCLSFSCSAHYEADFFYLLIWNCVRRGLRLH